MKKFVFSALALLLLFSCGKKVEKVKPEWHSITESVYASGIVKSKDQYQAYATVNGIVDSVFVNEGDSVREGQVIMSIHNQTQRLNRENALLAARFADLNSNQDKIKEAGLQLELAGNKMRSDSLLYFRQKNLWSQQIGTKVELEQRELAYQNSKTNFYSARVRSEDLKRQLELNSTQSKNNLEISTGLSEDYKLKSEFNGVVYDLLKSKGEIVSLQTPLAVVGRAGQFILEMQVDEYDIFKLKTGQEVIVTMDSYRGQVFEARISKIYPIMNERSKSFLVEASFVNPPPTLYPNVSFEASIVISRKEKAMLIPRSCMVNDSTVVKEGGDTVKVKTGLKDFQMMEILSGLNESDAVLKPKK